MVFSVQVIYSCGSMPFSHTVVCVFHGMELSVTFYSKLSEVFPDYPEHLPQTLTALREADPEALASCPQALLLRGQMSDLLEVHASHTIHSPWDALELLSRGYVLHPFERKWRAYLLDEHRRPVLSNVSGSSRYTSLVSPIIFKPEAFRGIKHGYRWLVVYGGSPDILSKPGVSQGLATCLRDASAAVSDVLFYDRAATPVVLYSARAGTGMVTKGLPQVDHELLTALHTKVSESRLRKAGGSDA